MAEREDATHLQRRARRRLVGAIALVVFVVIVFPIVLENERKPVGQDLVIQIPSQDAGKFTPRVPPGKAFEPAAGLQPGAAKGDVPGAPGAAARPDPPPSAQPAPPRESAAAAPPASSRSAPAAPQSEGKRAPAAPERSDAWAVQVGAFTEARNAKLLQARLSAAGLKSYIETIKVKSGEQTRVRVGPFEAKAEAQKAGEKLKAMGLRADLVPVAAGSGR
ncbi:MAG: SPOR domain-containing protein [Betaproteobacteria bacterium]|nr:SPOR domain-containing protein [Betaproteobacteria bacterium]